MRTGAREVQLQCISRVRRSVSVETLEDRRLLSGVTTLATFADSGPFNPSGTLVRDSSGTLYGIVQNVGSQDKFSGIFKLPKGSSTPTLVVSFPPNGAFSVTPDGLIIDSNDNIFGVTENGGDSANDGTLFELAKGASAVTTLAQFTQSTTGHSPNGNIVMDTSGNIYGVCDSGGTLGGGTVWRWAKNTGSLSQVAPFPQGSGLAVVPGANSIAIDSTGNLFGTAGGTPLAGDYGSVWEVGFGGSTINTLARFSGTNGSVPNGLIYVDANDNVFGETHYGGANGNGNTPAGLGTVYEVANGTGMINSIASFDGTNGEYPVGGLVADSNGNLFGVASKGGNVTAQTPSGAGTVFEVVQGSGAITDRASFSETDGKLPEGGLLISAGTVYGTTSAGGSQLGGTVFQLGSGGSSGSSTYTATISAKSPANVIAGQKFAATIASALTNTGSSTVSDVINFSVYLSADGAVDSNSILLVSSGGRSESIRAHKALTAKANIRSVPAATPAGAYHFIAEYKNSTGATTDAISSNTITVAAPKIDIGGAFAKFVSKAVGGKPVVETIAVSNVGANVAAAGTLSIIVAFEDSSNPLAGGAPIVFKKKVNIKPGKALLIPLAVKAPLTAGSYSVTVNLDTSGITTASDANPANNSFTSATALVVA